MRLRQVPFLVLLVKGKNVAIRTIKVLEIFHLALLQIFEVVHVLLLIGINPLSQIRILEEKNDWFTWPTFVMWTDDDF